MWASIHRWSARSGVRRRRFGFGAEHLDETVREVGGVPNSDTVSWDPGGHRLQPTNLSWPILTMGQA